MRTKGYVHCTRTLSVLMDRDSVTQSINFTLASSGKGSTPSVKPGSVQCQMISDANIKPASILAATVSRWYWKATIDNVADGVLTITINSPQSQSGARTGVSHFSTMNLFPAQILTDHRACAIRLPTISYRKGKKNNVMVFPDSDYDTAALTENGGNLVFTHSAFRAEKLRYSINFGKNRTDWTDWEDTMTILKSSAFKNKEFLWKGNHAVVNCEFKILPASRIW